MIDEVRNWYEDFEHENGQYLCRCVDCGRQFIGHKRRVICKACDTKHLQAELASTRRQLAEYDEVLCVRCGHNIEFIPFEGEGLRAKCVKCIAQFDSSRSAGRGRG